MVIVSLWISGKAFDRMVSTYRTRNTLGCRSLAREDKKMTQWIRVVKGTAAPVALAVVLIVASQARAAWTNTDPLITVDEFGVGTLDFTAEGGPILPLTGVLAPDPGPGGLPSVLTYDLLGPPALVP